MNCPACAAAVGERASTCFSCGLELTAPPTATHTTVARRERGPSSDHDPRHGRFTPGAVVARRYRIVERIGQGGMGEVYHAEDLTLEQPVALKFLPEPVSHDPQRMQALKREVRTARQISHPHVCRVYDITEADGLCFLSMEYIRGEDLRSLLKRVGRLPPERASQVAWQLAAGLAAAHDRGVLHRDLKPANVIVDELGQARILDFGIAAAAGAIATGEIRAGTPAYMAPEQALGRGVSERSDLYSLGLVLYELFTGKPAMSEPGPDGAPRPPSSLVAGLDRAVDEVILGCLQRDASLRPGSALGVRAAFAGGDMLTLAVARGETPGPELVADAGDFAGLAPPVAWACLAGALLALGGTVWAASRSRLGQLVPLPKPPAALVSDAREALEALGYPTPQRDASFGFSRHAGYIDHLMAGQPPSHWELLRRGEPSVIRFWYRESPQYLVPHRTTEFFPSEHDPPASVPGMVGVELDTRGRLRRLDAVPPDRDDGKDGPREPDWGPLFAAARLDPTRLTPAEPSWVPPAYADQRAAWVGRHADAPEVEVRVEAASLRGRAVAFRIVEPWTPVAGDGSGASRFVRSSDAVTENWQRALFVALHSLLLLGLALLARRNLRSGRGDTKLASRLAAVLFGLVMLQWLLAAHHVPERSELELFFGGLYRAFFTLGLAWLFYIALEPYARSLWPRSLTSWVRLLSGRWRDPLVGRDVLVGCVYGMVFGLVFAAHGLMPSLPGDRLPRPDLPVHPAALLALRGVREAVAELVAVQVNIATHVLYLFMALLLLRFLVRKTWLAVALHCAFYLVVTHTTYGLLAVAAWITLWHVVFFRFGWLSILVGTFTVDLLNGFPLTTDLSSWHAYATLIPVGACLALTVYGFKVSLGQRPAFKDLLAGP